MGDFDAKLRPLLESLLEPGETLEGICACSQQKGLLKGGAVALGVTDARLLVQPLNRRGDPDGDVQPIAPGDIVKAKAQGAGGGWADIGSAIMDRAAVQLELRLVDGEKLRLMMMRAEGSPGMTWLAGGEGQRQGVQALGEWFRRADSGSG
jgi:hypothetical protein